MSACSIHSRVASKPAETQASASLLSLLIKRQGLQSFMVLTSCYTTAVFGCLYPTMQATLQDDLGFDILGSLALLYVLYRWLQWRRAGPFTTT